MPPRKRPIQVFKFGGTSVGSAEAIRSALQLCVQHAPRLVVVVSAMDGVTNRLHAMAAAAAGGDRDGARAIVREILERHRALIRELFPVASVEQRLAAGAEAIAQRLASIGDSVAVLHELTPRTQDLIVSQGERLLADIFAAALSGRGVRTSLVDPAEIIATEHRADGVWPLFDRTKVNAAKRIAPRLANGVVVVAGYIGVGPDGEVVTLGRGGSDLSAAILARALSASSVTLWKDVDGLMTADPAAVPDARVLESLHPREAAELAFYGARVLHPRTMIPLADARIPLFLRNTFNPSFAGTRIAADVAAGTYPVKALTAIEHQALLAVEGSGMIGVPGVAARTFGALAETGHSVTMISQSSSEASICFVVPEREAAHAVRALERAFATEIRERYIDRIAAERDVALVAVVGLGMRGTPGIAARTFGAVSREGVNVLAIAQGSSELNITIAIRNADAPRALRALHREYQLDRIRALPDLAEHRTAVTLLGFGQIGRALARQMIDQDRYFRYDRGVELACVAVADRGGVKVREQGMTLRALGELIERKAQGTGVGVARRADPARVARALRQGVFRLPARRAILVDVTADETAPLLLEALTAGLHVVLANKKPLAVPQAEYDALFAAARAAGVSIRYEATVGAGLPVLDTLAKLRDAGDAVLSIAGCLSGTLGYLMTRIEEGVPFSAAVEQAWKLGYTEPDPRDDLSGMDVARKALILSRTLGRRLDLEDIRLEPLFPPERSHAVPKTFVAGLAVLDREMAERAERAKARGQVLRYVARIGPRSVRVGIEALDASSPLGRLRGTDNQVVIQTKRYDANPLIVTGPGAGAEVTAAGVLNDLVAIATSDRAAPERRAPRSAR